MAKSSNVVPIRPLRSEPTPELQQELQDRLWGEERHAYREEPVDLPKEAIKAWRRATLLTWVMLWSWWRF